jgi:hypothetical protein
MSICRTFALLQNLVLVFVCAFFIGLSGSIHLGRVRGTQLSLYLEVFGIREGDALRVVVFVIVLLPY